MVWLGCLLLTIDVAGWWLAWAVTHPVHGRGRAFTPFTRSCKRAGQRRADRSRWIPGRTVHEAFTPPTVQGHTRRSERSRTVHAVHAGDRSRCDPLLWRGGRSHRMDSSQPWT